MSNKRFVLKMITITLKSDRGYIYTKKLPINSKEFWEVTTA